MRAVRCGSLKRRQEIAGAARKVMSQLSAPSSACGGRLGWGRAKRSGEFLCWRCPLPASAAHGCANAAGAWMRRSGPPQAEEGKETESPESSRAEACAPQKNAFPFGCSSRARHASRFHRCRPRHGATGIALAFSPAAVNAMANRGSRRCRLLFAGFSRLRSSACAPRRRRRRNPWNRSKPLRRKA